MTTKDSLRAAESDPLDRPTVAEAVNQFLGGINGGSRFKSAPLRLFTVKQVAEALGLSTDTIYALIKSGQLVAVRLQADTEGSRYHYRVRPEEYEAYLQRCVYDAKAESTESGSKISGG